MAFPTLGHARGRLVRPLAVFFVLLAAGASNGRGGYRYQTHHTPQSLGVPWRLHAAVKLGDGRVGLFGGGAHLDVQLFDPATERFITSKATQWFAHLASAS